MIPWRFSIGTSLSPDKVLMRLQDITYREVETGADAPAEFSVGPATKIFGGTIDWALKSFSFRRNSQTTSALPEFRPFIEGHAGNKRGQTYIWVWVRPSLRWFLLLGLLLLPTIRMMVYLFRQDPVFWSQLQIVLPLWLLAGAITYSQVKTTRALFEAIFRKDREAGVETPSDRQAGFRP